MATSSKGAPSTEAVTYGEGSNGGYVLKDDSDYKTPEIVTKLAKSYKIELGGAKSVAEEVSFLLIHTETITFYLLRRK